MLKGSRGLEERNREKREKKLEENIVFNEIEIENMCKRLGADYFDLAVHLTFWCYFHTQNKLILSRRVFSTTFFVIFVDIFQCFSNIFKHF